MKKIISLLVCACVLLSAMVFTTSAAETSATITFDDSSKATWSETQQLWQENGITVTNNKAGSTTNIDVSKKYSNPARFYKGSELIVEYPGMTKLVFDHNGVGTKYVGLANSFSDSNATAVSDANTTTITFATPVDSFTFNSMSVQCRVYSITVYAGGESGGETTDPVDPPVDEPTFDPSTATPAEIVDAAYALEGSEKIENVTLTGVITAVNTPYSDQYGNITVTIAVEGKEDKPIKCYRLAGEGADNITIDDKITVTGTIALYNGAPQFTQGCTLDAVEKGEFEIVIPEDPKEIVDAAFVLEEGTSLLYEATLTGEVVEISEAYNEAYGNVTLTISVEGTDGMHDLLCYRMKGDGADTIEVGDTITVTGTIKNYNGTIEFDSGCTFVFADDGTTDDGTTDDGTTDDGTTDDGTTDDGTTDDGTTDDGTTDDGATVVETPVAGTAYKFGMIQGNVSETTVFYLAGGMNGYYMATTDKAAEAIDVYLEETDGGYYFYTMVDDAKSYINMVVSGTHVNGAYEAAASTVYTYDTESQTLIADVDGAPYWFGTRNDNSYTTVGPCKTEYNGFYCKFYPEDVTDAPDDGGDEGGETPEPPVNNDPAADSTLTIEEAIALGASKAHNTYTEAKYYVTGKIVEVYGPQYGNMRITDENGNILTLYGTWSADGQTRYDALEVKPIAGDTITVYGIIGQYSDTPQLKNGWIVDHVKGEGEAPVAPETAEEILADAEKLEPGQTLPYEATLTGTIVSIDTEYSEQYGNITVTIAVKGTDKTIQCFRMKGEGADLLIVGDEITVTGYITNYNGVVQFNTGATFVPAVEDDTNDDDGDDIIDDGTNDGDVIIDDNTPGEDNTTTPDTNGSTTQTSPVTGDSAVACVTLGLAALAVIAYCKKR